MNATQIAAGRKELQAQDSSRKIKAVRASETRKAQPRRQAQLRWWDFFRMSNA